MRAGDKSLFSLIHNYLKIYLPKQRNVSPNTIRSYKKALEELLDYIKEREQIPFGQLTFEHLTTDLILSFLEYLETEKGCSIPTRNIICRKSVLRASRIRRQRCGSRGPRQHVGGILRGKADRSASNIVSEKGHGCQSSALQTACAETDDGHGKHPVGTG